MKVFNRSGLRLGQIVLKNDLPCDFGGHACFVYKAHRDAQIENAVRNADAFGFKITIMLIFDAVFGKFEHVIQF